MQTMKATSPNDLAHAAARASSDRQVYSYAVPPSLSGLGVASVGLVELTAEEEMMATRRAHGDPVRLAFELSKESLRMIDGKSVGLANGSADSAWQSMHPKVRNLVVMAYGSLHAPRDDEQAAFLQSRQVAVG